MANIPDRFRYAFCILVLAILGGMLLAWILPLFATWRLEDFAVTFYPAARYLWRGENVYLNNYPHPDTGLQYPPYAPIWILYAFVPFAALPLPTAEALRLLMDVALLPLLAYLSARWARIENIWLTGLLVAAPWLLTEVSAGQITPVVFIGVFLCYWGLRRSSPPMTAIGILLTFSKFTIVSLVILATVVIAWRRNILGRTFAILGSLIVAASLWNPTWILDVARLYFERLAAPRLTDSVLLLPGYPWSQLALLGLGALLTIGYLVRSHQSQPTPWLWALLVCASLVGAPHTFVYDWQLLMLPLAYLLCDRRAVLFVVALYAYSFLWAFLMLANSAKLPSPSIIPALVLASLFAHLVYSKSRARRTLRHSEPLANPGSHPWG